MRVIASQNELNAPQRASQNGADGAESLTARWQFDSSRNFWEGDRYQCWTPHLPATGSKRDFCVESPKRAFPWLKPTRNPALIDRVLGHLWRHDARRVVITLDHRQKLSSQIGVSSQQLLAAFARSGNRLLAIEKEVLRR